MKFDWFVLPFISGLVFLWVYLFLKFRSWVLALSSDDRAKLTKHLFSKNISRSIKEIFNEALLHKRIFKVNHLLGYMHMSLAFGWFLLIVIGNIEIKFYSEYTVNPPYVPIFLRFFETNPLPHFFGRGSNFIMDLLLLFILTGVSLAVYKRFRKKRFGLKQTTKHHSYDKLSLTFLWLIFPLRLLAESFTSGIYDNGSFLTWTLGNVFAMFLPLRNLIYPAWWAYSVALGGFFFTLPLSRYMHIPSEILLIIFRNSGIKPKQKMDAYSNVEIHSCSRCGICIDSCQLATSTGITTIQPAYFLTDIRYQQLHQHVVDNCLICGRCNTACPVGITSTAIRQAKRIEQNNYLVHDYSRINTIKFKKAEVLYFAGCMTHLTPGIKKSMVEILDTSKVKWDFLDKDGTICCGRPLLLSGMIDSAKELMDKNTATIKASGAKTLVTSCPICFKAFTEEYKLNIEVLHHTQYLKRLLDSGKIKVNKTSLTVVYHDPCELGRGSGIFNEPREVLSQVADLLKVPQSYDSSLCCGGSLGNIVLTEKEKKQIASDAISNLKVKQSEGLVTACPMCKKLFQAVSEKPVSDIAEMVASNMFAGTKSFEYHEKGNIKIETEVNIHN